jgi:hypothetical protein
MTKNSCQILSEMKGNLTKIGVFPLLPPPLCANNAYFKQPFEIREFFIGEPNLVTKFLKIFFSQFLKKNRQLDGSTTSV